MNSSTTNNTAADLQCEVCGNNNIPLVLDLGKHPLCDDLIPIGDTRESEVYPIEILFCGQCITAHQKFQVPKRTLFPTTYHYRSRFTEDVLRGMSALVDTCEQKLGTLQGKLVLDVGCNDGSLLDFFKAKGAVTIGIDPTDAVNDAFNKDHKLIQGYFDQNTAAQILQRHGVPDIVTFTNVFAHIENLPELIASLLKLMGPQSMLVVENHYLGAVLDRFQFDTFYHEHPRTYSLTSLVQIARNLGSNLTGVDFPSRYGGNIRVFIGGPKDFASVIDWPEVQEVLEKEKQFGARLLDLQSTIERWKSSTKTRIDELVARHGRLSAKGFPGRAAILIKLLNLDSDIIEAVYEKPGSMKIGHYIPGTRIPIKSDDEFWALQHKPTVILNLAWHISSEISSYFQKHGYSGEIVNILNPEELV